ncbi:hypothetical protein IGL98_002791 [Enterococcus sp. DIV0840]|uniref:hypothetical protein n=1 Tax=unclassified Enterococcus TaxID=2608891 RepID=UPI001A8C4C5A|nr:hypothetical protein [Enterococcus sp. DIV0849a]MBO0434778.1 hypothetical protein [Enterococcus sp. DIV0849a]
MKPGNKHSLAVAAHHRSKGFTSKGTKPSKNPVLKGSKGGKNHTLDRDKSKGSSGYKKASGAKVPKVEIPEQSLNHADIGDFTVNFSTGKVSKMKGGGHGQANIDFLKENGMVGSCGSLWGIGKGQIHLKTLF